MPSSVTSTKSSACTNPENDTLSDVLLNDKIRYARKGYGLISAICIAMAFFLLAPRVLERYYESILELLGSKRSALILGSLVVELAVFWSLNLGMWVIYKLEHPFFQKYKSNMNPWPWKLSPEDWSQGLRRTIKVLLFNQLVLSPTVLYLDSLTAEIDLDFSTGGFPSTVTLMMQLLFCMFVEDFAFYWIHRAAHHRRFYKYIHKQHHEYNTSIGLASMYAHPLEFVFANMLPTGLGIKLLGSHMHIVTLWLWLFLRTAETVDGHCGYDFSWSPYRLFPLSGGGMYHDFHHSHNVGNYGSFFSIWDTIFGTNTHYFKYLAMKESAQDISEAKAHLDTQYEEERLKQS